MKILITGCAGYIGSKLTTFFTKLNKNNQIIGIDNLLYNQKSLGHLADYNNFKFYNLDVRNPDFINLLKIKNDFDFIFPLAALVGVKICNVCPSETIAINYKQIIDIVNWKLKTKSNAKIVYLNTNSGYGIGGPDYCTEKSPLNPISLYGKSKCAAERYLLRNCSFDTMIFRLATVFGPSFRFRQDLLVNDFVARAYYDKFIILFESWFRRNYISIQDVIKAFHWTTQIDKSLYGVYNLGLSEANFTKKELCLKIKEQLPEFIIKEDEFSKDPDKRNYIVSNKKIEKAGFKAQTKIQTGIKQLIRFYETLPKREFTNS